jgi:DNA-binding sugar fermentation-stimulating protein
MELYKIDETYTAIVVSRPSKIIKSPYLADIYLENDTETIYMCHTPSLGCCGMIVPGARVIVGKINNGVKAKYVVYHVFCGERIIGTHPLIAQKIGKSYLINHYPAILWQNEKVVQNGGSRFDYVGYNNDTLEMVVECKAIPLGDIEDYDMKTRKIRGYLNDMDNTNKIAIFPDGFRKKKDEPVSPRALKHIKELCELKVITRMLLFICQRNDCTRFTISKLDPIYREAVLHAIKEGVLVKCIAISWSTNGKTATFMNELQFVD